MMTNYISFREKSVYGRYVVSEQLEKFIDNWGSTFKVRTEGSSVQNRPIKSMVLGKGSTKIFMWSQMHGNESTTTKAVLDLINYLASGSELPLEAFSGSKGPTGFTAQKDSSRSTGAGARKKSEGNIAMGPITAAQILDSCTLTILPMLNPDGAVAYTRANANDIDLNRDAAERTQPESKVLRKVFDRFRPDYCFNLHDQRTIYNVGDTAKPATVSFLAPAYDEKRKVSPSRLESMRLIAAMNHQLQKVIPGQIGRYDDAFNPNCVGDAFQMTGTPTLLFEAGHYSEDYQRERTREYIFHALMTALRAISERSHSSYQESDYFKIPENGKQFFDILIHNAQVLNSSLKKGTAIGILYSEELKNGRIHFEPKIEEKGDLTNYFGHQEYNCVADNELIALKRRPELLEILSDF